MNRRLFCTLVAGFLSLILGFAAQADNISAAINAINTPGMTSALASGSAPIALGAYYYDAGMCAPGDAGAVASWRARTGTTPALWMIFQSWTDWNKFPVAQAKRAHAMGSSFLVTWEPWSGRKGDASWSCKNVVTGAHDTYIREYARAVKSAVGPVLLRFAHEMNGDWYPWGTANTSYSRRNNGNSPEDYVAMWKHVVAIFRAEGAKNARWVWAPNIFATNQFNSERAQTQDLIALYPGDEWVDWIGLSVYNDGSRRPWTSFSLLFDGAYRIVTSLTQKPLMVAEMGVTEQGAPRGQSKAHWIAQTFLSDIPNRYSRVKLVNYFCRDKTAFGEANYRFDSSPDSLKAFRAVANSPLYAGKVN